MTFGERAADWVAENIGRWAFIIGQTIIIAGWMWSNAAGMDPFPWMFLNLALSLQAAYTGPVLLISANRADRLRMELLEKVDRHTEMIEAHTDQTQASILEMRRDHRRIMVHLGMIEAELGEVCKTQTQTR